MKILAYHFLPFWNVTNAKCGTNHSTTQNAKYNGVKIWKGPTSWRHRWTCESMFQLFILLSPNVDQILMSSILSFRFWKCHNENNRQKILLSCILHSRVRSKTENRFIGVSACMVCQSNKKMHPAWMGGGLGENGDVCMFGWVALLCTRNYHNIVNLLYSNTK